MTGRGHFAIHAAGDAEHTSHSGRFILVDLSADGARIETREIAEEHLGPLMTGDTRITLLLDDAIDAHVKVTGAVRWMKRRGTGYVLGVEFLSVSDQNAARLRAFLYRSLDRGDATPRHIWFQGVRRRRAAAYVAAAVAAVLLGLLIGRLSIVPQSPAPRPVPPRTYAEAPEEARMPY
jgi:hypothetical protein